MRKKDISFGDGNFTFNDIKGISVPVFVLVLLNEILLRFNRKYRDGIFLDLAAHYVKVLPDFNIKTKEVNKPELDKVLDFISMFGLGKFFVRLIKPGKIMIENKNNLHAAADRSISA